jgi:serine/threonine protein kinase
VIFGAFEILSRIAGGGMGDVFRARRLAVPGREVALKLMRSDCLTDAHYRDMFQIETEVSARLDHPNVVRVVASGQVDGIPFLAQELVDGASLDRLLRRGPFEEDLAVHVVLKVLAALEYIHSVTDEAGRPLTLVHRDVSPSNVIVSKSGEVKLTDFGIVKVQGRSVTRTGEIKGKRTCMAPEQLESGRVDARVDVFAVAVLFHVLLFGHGPFDDVAGWLRSGAPVLCGGRFQGVLARALAVDVTARHGSAAELARAIMRVLPPALDAPERLAERVKASRRPPRARVRPAAPPVRASRDEAATVPWVRLPPPAPIGSRRALLFASLLAALVAGMVALVTLAVVYRARPAIPAEAPLEPQLIVTPLPP